MPSPIYQYVINLVVSLPIKWGPGVFMYVRCGEHRTVLTGRKTVQSTWEEPP